MITSIRRLQTWKKKVTEVIREAVDYFQTNRKRMRYAYFRDQGFLRWVGSGGSGLQNHHYATAQAIKDAKDRQRRQRDYRIALLHLSDPL